MEEDEKWLNGIKIIKELKRQYSADKYSLSADQLRLLLDYDNIILEQLEKENKELKEQIKDLKDIQQAINKKIQELGWNE